MSTVYERAIFNMGTAVLHDSAVTFLRVSVHGHHVCCSAGVLHMLFGVFSNRMFEKLPQSTGETDEHRCIFVLGDFPGALFPHLIASSPSCIFGETRVL